MNDTLLGQRFGRLVVLSYVGKTGKEHRPTYLCRCDCGTEKPIMGKSLKSGNSNSCGCLQREKASERASQRAYKLAGKTFGRLTVIERSGYSGHLVLWECLCNCGNVTHAKTHSLVSGQTQSCGCLARDLASQRKMVHGHCVDDTLTPTYVTWMSMRGRCTNPDHPSWPNYGAKGVTCCKKWLESFEAFLKDLGVRPEGKTLDRRDGTKGYSPENCRWATPKEQANNLKTNIRVEFQGNTFTLSELADALGLDYNSLHYQYRRRRLSLDESIARATPRKE